MIVSLSWVVCNSNCQVKVTWNDRLNIHNYKKGDLIFIIFFFCPGYMLIGNDVKLNSPSSLIGQALAEILQYPDRSRDALRVLLHLVRHTLFTRNTKCQSQRHTKILMLHFADLCRWRSLFREYRTASAIPCIRPSRVWRTRWGVSLAGRPCWQLWASVLTLPALASLLLSSFPLLTQATSCSSAAPLCNHY